MAAVLLKGKQRKYIDPYDNYVDLNACAVKSVKLLISFCSHEEIASKFDQLDKDGNGVLSPDEVVIVIQDMMGFDPAMARWMVQMFDQNQDGSLDKTEFMQLWTSMFGWTSGPVRILLYFCLADRERDLPHLLLYYTHSLHVPQIEFCHIPPIGGGWAAV